MTTQLARWATLDACPTPCGNVEPPVGITTDARPRDYIAAYRCHDCGCTWTTSWKD